MNLKIYYFSIDSDSGMFTQLFTSLEKLAAAIHSKVEESDPDTATAMRAVPFNSPDWGFLWGEYVEDQEKSCNYYHHGEQAVDTTNPAANQPEKGYTSHIYDIMEVPMISTAHITQEDRAQLLKGHPQDVFATIYDSSGHIIHSLTDEPIDEAFPLERFSEAFRAMFLYFRQIGFEYVRIDSNGPVIPDLPTFD